MSAESPASTPTCSHPAKTLPGLVESVERRVSLGRIRLRPSGQKPSTRLRGRASRGRGRSAVEKRSSRHPHPRTKSMRADSLKSSSVKSWGWMSACHYREAGHSCYLCQLGQRATSHVDCQGKDSRSRYRTQIDTRTKAQRPILEGDDRFSRFHSHGTK